MAVDWNLKTKTMQERSAEAAAKRAKKDEAAKSKADEHAEKDDKRRRGVAKLAEMKVQMQLEDEEDDENYHKKAPGRRQQVTDDEYEEDNEEVDEMEVDPENAPKKVRSTRSYCRRRTRVLVTLRSHTRILTFPLTPLLSFLPQLSKKQKNRLAGVAITEAIDQQVKNIRSNALTATRYVLFAVIYFSIVARH